MNREKSKRGTHVGSREGQPHRLHKWDSPWRIPVAEPEPFLGVAKEVLHLAVSLGARISKR